MAQIETITASLRTDKGLVRGHNEDFVGSWEPKTLDEQDKLGWLYIVADGVGGAEAGEVASQHATERAIHHYVESEQEDDSAERLLHAVKSANEDLRTLAASRSRGSYMATTMVAALIQDGQCTFINVGDSRGYHLRAGAMRQVTKDQSLVAQLLEEGAITPEEAANHPRRNVILSSLGPMREPRIDTFDVSLSIGDSLLLCSDGLTRHVSDEEIARIITHEPPEEASKILIDLANARGGSDNISVAILNLGGKQNKMRVAPKLSGTMSHQPANSLSIWSYTIILSIIEALLIFAAWYMLRV